MANQKPTHDSADGLPAFTNAVRDPRLRIPPFWMISLFVIATVATWVPLVFFARARVTRSELPRVHFVQDMGTQPKYREQQTSEVFADRRADRPRIEGTVARGRSDRQREDILQEDDAYYRGFVMKMGDDGKPAPTFTDGFPKQVKLDEQLLKRGQERFNIYCSVCHGLDGYGNGPVAQRATEIGNAINPANLHDPKFRDRPNGNIYNTINIGVRNMPGYGAQIPVEDRWAIVAYVRALELSQNAPPGVLPADKRATLPVSSTEAGK